MLRVVKDGAGYLGPRKHKWYCFEFGKKSNFDNAQKDEPNALTFKCIFAFWNQYKIN
jgi:hypothetical protein